MTQGSIWKEFACSTDMHGVKFIPPADTSKSSKIRSVVWLVFVLVALGVLIWYIGFSVERYSRYEVNTRILTEGLDIPLPDIGFCPVVTDNVVQPSDLTPTDILNAPSPKYGSLEMKMAEVIEERNGERFIKADALAFFKALNDDNKLILSAEALKYWSSEQITGMAKLAVNRKKIGKKGYVVTKDDEDSLGMFNNWPLLIERLSNGSTTSPIPAASQFNINDVMERTGAEARVVGKMYVLDPDFRSVPLVYNRQNFLGTTCQVATDIYLTKSALHSKVVIAVFLKSPVVAMFPFRMRSTATKFFFATPHSLLAFGEGQNKFTIMDEQSVYDGTLKRSAKNVFLGDEYGKPCGRDQDLEVLGPGWSVSKSVQECIWRNRSLDMQQCVSPVGNDTECQLERDEVKDTFKWCVGIEDRLPCEYNIFDMEVKEGVKKSDIVVMGKRASAKITIGLDQMAEYVTTEEFPDYPIESLFAELGGMMGLLLGMSALTVVHVFEFIISAAFCRVKNNEGDGGGDGENKSPSVHVRVPPVPFKKPVV